MVKLRPAAGMSLAAATLLLTTLLIPIVYSGAIEPSARTLLVEISSTQAVCNDVELNNGNFDPILSDLMKVCFDDYLST